MAYKRIPIAYSVPSAQSNMPLYVKPSVMTGWGSLTLAEAQSGRWYADEDMVTQIAREVASADEIHVKFPTVPTTGGEGFHDYDGVRADLAVTDTYGRNAVWSDFLGVWQMKDLTTSTVTDSTGNDRTGTKGEAGVPEEVNGKINKAQEFGTTYSATNAVLNKRITMPSGLGSEVGSGDFTLTTVVFVNATHTGQQRHVYMGNSSSYGNLAEIFTDTTSNNNIIARLNFGSTVNLTRTNPIVGSYFFVTFVRNGTTAIFYINGSEVDNVTDPNVAGTVGPAFVVGNWGLSSARTTDGNIDQTKIRKSALSPNWVTTEYNNQNDVASFWGTVTDAGGAPVTNNGFMAWL